MQWYWVFYKCIKKKNEKLIVCVFLDISRRPIHYRPFNTFEKPLFILHKLYQIYCFMPFFVVFKMIELYQILGCSFIFFLIEFYWEKRGKFSLRCKFLFSIFTIFNLFFFSKKLIVMLYITWEWIIQK